MATVDLHPADTPIVAEALRDATTAYRRWQRSSLTSDAERELAAVKEAALRRALEQLSQG